MVVGEEEGEGDYTIVMMLPLEQLTPLTLMMVPTGTKRDRSNDWVIAVLYECTTCTIVPSEGPTVVNKGRKKKLPVVNVIVIAIAVATVVYAAATTAIVVGYYGNRLS